MKKLYWMLSAVTMLLNSSCNRQPIACVESNASIVEIGETIAFTNCGMRGRSYEWNFGDGTLVNSTDMEKKVHAYNAIGTYTVELCAYSNKQDKSDCANVSVQVVNYPTALFTMDSTTCSTTCLITFTNSSTFADNYLWDFGDGSTSSLENPTHEYDQSGDYEIKLTASNTYKSSVATANLIVIDPYPPSSAFTYLADGNFVPMGVEFDNLSSNATAYQWNFGDGYYSTEFEPYHIYQGAGSYMITLLTTNPYGESTHTEWITVAGAPTSCRIDEIELLSCPMVDNGGAGWDSDCDGTPPDIYFAINDNVQNLFVSGFFENVNVFPAWYQNSTGFPFTLNPLYKQFTISLFDIDDVSCAPDDQMTMFSFNPSNLIPTDGSSYPTAITLNDGMGVELTMYLTWY